MEWRYWRAIPRKSDMFRSVLIEMRNQMKCMKTGEVSINISIYEIEIINEQKSVPLCWLKELIIYCTLCQTFTDKLALLNFIDLTPFVIMKSTEQ